MLLGRWPCSCIGSQQIHNLEGMEYEPSYICNLFPEGSNFNVPFLSINFVQKTCGGPIFAGPCIPSVNPHEVHYSLHGLHILLSRSMKIMKINVGFCLALSMFIIVIRKVLWSGSLNLIHVVLPK